MVAQALKLQAAYDVCARAPDADDPRRASAQEWRRFLTDVQGLL